MSRRYNPLTSRGRQPLCTFIWLLEGTVQDFYPKGRNVVTASGISYSTCGNFNAAEILILSYSQQPACLEITSTLTVTLSWGTTQMIKLAVHTAAHCEG